MTIGKPYKITIEHLDRKVIIEQTARDDGLEAYADLLRAASLAIGWGEASLDEVFVDWSQSEKV
jgi:hypothetical protein